MLSVQEENQSFLASLTMLVVRRELVAVLLMLVSWEVLLKLQARNLVNYAQTGTCVAVVRRRLSVLAGKI